MKRFNAIFHRPASPGGSDMQKYGKIWFVLADGAQARILQRRSAEPRGFTVIVHEMSPEAQLSSHELATDRPGRSYESASPSRHAVDWKTDPHEAAKAQFERKVADLVNRAAEEGLFDALVMVAPPRVLGAMRKALSEQAKERLVLEEGKDLLKLPEHALTVRLSALLRR
jgi:protein required for attachment to host cells